MSKFVLMKGQNFLDSIRHQSRHEWLLMDACFEPWKIVPKYIPWHLISGCVCLRLLDTNYAASEMFEHGLTQHETSDSIHIFRRPSAMNRFRMVFVDYQTIPNWNALRRNISRTEPCVLMGRLGVNRYQFKFAHLLLGMKHATTVPDCDSRRWIRGQPHAEATNGDHVWHLYCMVNHLIRFCEQRVIADRWTHIRIYVHPTEFPVSLGLRSNNFHDMIIPPSHTVIDSLENDALISNLYQIKAGHSMHVKNLDPFVIEDNGRLVVTPYGNLLLHMHKFKPKSAHPPLHPH